MAWNFFEDPVLSWPTELSATNLKKLDKKKQCGGLIEILTSGEKEFGKLTAKREQPAKKASHDKAARWVKASVAVANGAEIKAVNGTLKLAQAEAKKLLMSKTPLEKSVSPVLIKLQRVSGQCQSALDRKKLIQDIGRIGKELEAEHKKYTLGRIGSVLKTMKACSKKGHPGLKTAAKALQEWDAADEEVKKRVRGTIRVQIFNTSRDMTQNLKNLTQAVGYGGEIPGLEPRDIKAMPKMLTVLEPLANEQGSSEISDMDKADLKSTILIVAAQAKLFDKISARLP